MTTDELKKYKRALKYAHAIDPKNDRDLLHDTYLSWFKKTGKNLFEESQWYIHKVIKYEHFNSLRRNSYMINGVRQRKYNLEFNPDYMGWRSTTPEDEYIAKELETKFLSTTNDVQLEIYLYAVQGYRPSEIAQLLGENIKFVTYYFKRMAYVASLFN